MKAQDPEIIPAILSQTEQQFKKDVEKFISSKLVTLGWVHIDFMDNIFVPNKSINPLVVAKYPIPVKKEAHPMAAYPLKWVDKLKAAGFDRIIFHLESKDDPIKCIESIRAKELEVGVAINMDTPIERLESLAKLIDKVLVMSIVPGFQGQSFIPQSLERIRQLKAKGWNVTIGVDGAVNDLNAKALVEAGVDCLVVGSFLIRGNSDENLDKLLTAFRV